MAVRHFAFVGLALLGAIPVACGSGSSGGGASSDAGADSSGATDAGSAEVTLPLPLDAKARDGAWLEGGTSDGSAALCDGSPCQPVALAAGTNPSGAGGLAVDATNVYWVDSAGGQVLACAKTGCGGTPIVLASGQNGPSGIAVQGSTVFWSNAGAGTLVSCATAGCAKNPTVVVSGLASPGGVAVDATSLYWAETGGAGRVASCPLAGCTTPTVLASAPGLLLAVDEASVYFTDGANVNQCPLTGCTGAPTVLFAAAGATGIALDTANVYATADTISETSAGASKGAVLSCAKTGCASSPIALASGQLAPLPIAVASSTVYWGNTQGDGDLKGCASAGCKDSPKVIAMGAVPLSLAVDDTHVYWASVGAVLTLPR
jgi:hypothetical protein